MDEIGKFLMDGACIALGFILTFYAYTAIQAASGTSFSELAAVALLSAIGASVLFARRKLLDF